MGLINTMDLRLIIFCIFVKPFKITINVYILIGTTKLDDRILI